MRNIGDLLAIGSKCLTVLVLSGLLFTLAASWRGPDCPPNANTCISVE
jgi:hypothetical protein